MRRLIAAVLLASLALTSCSGDAERASGEISVFAASSLTDAFEELADTFERGHADVSVLLNVASSSELASQIEQGARADVFAAADRSSVDRVVDAGLTQGSPRVFARNRLALVTPPHDPGNVDALADLEREDLIVSLCDQDCPAGAYARRMLDQAGLEVSPDSLETEVRGVATRVSTGEADAGIVYASDAAAAGRALRTVPIPDRINVLAPYAIVVLEGAPAAAREFVDLLLSAEGQRIMARSGFLPR